MSAALEPYAHYAEEMRNFAREHVKPFASSIDREQHIPVGVIDSMREAGLFASGFPKKGGSKSPEVAVDAAIRHGILHEQLGWASASVQGLLNVHHMGGSAILRWGTRQQKEKWGPRLTSGEAMAAIAITEPSVGSDAAAVQTLATTDGDGWRVSGTKTWITCGQSADVFLVLCGTESGPLAVILPADTPGLAIEPIPYLLGCRGYMLATLHLEDCFVPAEGVLGRPGFGLSHVIATGLDNGRFNLAWGCVGLAQACVEASLQYSSEREQSGQRIGEFGQVQTLLAQMTTDVHAARLTCHSAAIARGQRSLLAAKETFMAKYLASTAANRVATRAIQVHGAVGVGPNSMLERAFRDARIMEIIEGTTQVVEQAIARFALHEV